MANENKKELPMWKRIKQGDKLPCQSFLRKKDGEILRLTTFGGVEVGQDCYYIPVDEVVNVIKDYPVEESEGEKIRKDIVEAVELHKDFTQERKERIYAWLEKQGEQKPAKNIVETWKDMRLEVYQQASGNRHEPNCSDDTTKMFSLNDIDEIVEKMSEQSPSDKVEPRFKKD